MNNHTDRDHDQPEYQPRRESLVKPTWHNVCPGQVPPETLEKLNQLGHTVHETTYPILKDNNNKINNKIVGNTQRRQVELFDIFGKVNISDSRNEHRIKCLVWVLKAILLQSIDKIDRMTATNNYFYNSTFHY